ncbi:hypothetical protein AVEN_193315-1 [Araneus ventricosus]|uniref:Uncharacterized protein n=1 Tax=Araneus ventricosus TaxID=182803 RepID=A0A4Y2UYR8_ARAVE|nr:hypothetical protein AVEN_193315-1 [Araneus ventricosus]
MGQVYTVCTLAPSPFFVITSRSGTFITKSFPTPKDVRPFQKAGPMKEVTEPSHQRRGKQRRENTELPLTTAKLKPGKNRLFPSSRRPKEKEKHGSPEVEADLRKKPFAALGGLTPRRHISSSPFLGIWREIGMNWTRRTAPYPITPRLVYPSLKAQVNELWLVRIIGPLPRLSPKRS